MIMFILGLIVGSFLNVVIYRYNTGFTLGGRSQCLACGKMLRWFELIPVFSFLAQKGKCRSCGSQISWQYPSVELVTAISFFLISQLRLPLASIIIYLAITCCLIVIVAYDWRHHIIPDGFVYGFIALAFLNSLLASPSSLLPNLLAGLGLAAFFWILWLISRGKWLGFADGKLALGIGLLAGPVAGVSAVVLAFWLGAVVGLALIAVSKLFRARGRVTMKSELPFAPFLILGLALVIFFNFNVFAFF